jgi:hypothetical protein
MEHPVGNKTFSPLQEKLYKQSNDLFGQIESLLDGLPTSRLVAMAKTQLEITGMVVNKAISRIED